MKFSTIFKQKWKKQHLGYLSFELSKLDQTELNLVLINVPSKILLDLLQFRGIVLEEKKYIHDKDIMTRKQAFKLANEMLEKHQVGKKPKIIDLGSTCGKFKRCGYCNSANRIKNKKCTECGKKI